MTELLLIGVAAIAGFVAAVFLVLLLARRLGGKKAVVVLGTAMVGLIVFEMFHILWTCSADPVIVPSEGGEGRAVFACDGPGGAFIYGFAYLICPAAAVLVWTIAYRLARSRPEINPAG